MFSRTKQGKPEDIEGANKCDKKASLKISTTHMEPTKLIHKHNPRYPSTAATATTNKNFTKIHQSTAKSNTYEKNLSDPGHKLTFKMDKSETKLRRSSLQSLVGSADFQNKLNQFKFTRRHSPGRNEQKPLFSRHTISLDRRDSKEFDNLTRSEMSLAGQRSVGIQTPVPKPRQSLLRKQESTLNDDETSKPIPKPRKKIRITVTAPAPIPKLRPDTVKNVFGCSCCQSPSRTNPTSKQSSQTKKYSHFTLRIPIRLLIFSLTWTHCGIPSTFSPVPSFQSTTPITMPSHIHLSLDSVTHCRNGNPLFNAPNESHKQFGFTPSSPKTSLNSGGETPFQYETGLSHSSSKVNKTSVFPLVQNPSPSSLQQQRWTISKLINSDFRPTFSQLNQRTSPASSSLHFASLPNEDGTCLPELHKNENYSGEGNTLTDKNNVHYSKETTDMINSFKSDQNERESNLIASFPSMLLKKPTTDWFAVFSHVFSLNNLWLKFSKELKTFLSVVNKLFKYIFR